MSQTQASLGEFEDGEVLSSFLPVGWDEQARKLGAIRRARYLKEPATVLRILLVHLASGCSLAETAARATAGGLARISAVGVFKRLRAAEPWLRWLGQQMRGVGCLALPALGRRLPAVEATTVSVPGATGAGGKVHVALNVADLQCDFFGGRSLTPRSHRKRDRVCLERLNQRLTLPAATRSMLRERHLTLRKSH